MREVKYEQVKPKDLVMIALVGLVTIVFTIKTLIAVFL